MSRFTKDASFWRAVNISSNLKITRETQIRKDLCCDVKQNFHRVCWSHFLEQHMTLELAKF